MPSGTTAAPYNVTNVKIDFTSDSGATWTTLAASVPNSGTASVAVPAALGGKTGHLRVSAIGNVFYAVNAATVGTLAVSDVNNTKAIQIFPNPVKDVLHFNMPCSVAVYSTDGKKVLTAVNAQSVNVTDLAVGAYFLKIDGAGQKTFNTKFIKQ